MHPILFVLPLPFSDVKILIYSVFFAITVSLVLGICLGTQAAQKRGLPVDIALNMTFVGLITLIVGARVYAFLENPSFYLAHPVRMIKLWEGSLATYGGAIGGMLGCVGYLFCRRQAVLPFLDTYAPYGFLGLGLIRVGDFLNGTAFGRPAEISWAVAFPKGSFAYNYQLHQGLIRADAAASLPVHPTQLYEASVCFLIFVLLLAFSGFMARRAAGAGFMLGALVYVASRFWIDCFRQDLQKDLPFGLASTQWVGAVLFIVLLVCVFFMKKSPGLAKPPPAQG
ncbi:MAG: prolipoprotein diacylglyceryl transferase [bacterium]